MNYLESLFLREEKIRCTKKLKKLKKMKVFKTKNDIIFILLLQAFMTSVATF